MDHSEIIRALQVREDSMREMYRDVEPSFRDAADWIDPARGRAVGFESNADRRKQRILIDSTPRKADRTLRSGLMGGLSSPSRPWFKLKLRGFEKPTHSILVWLEECQRRIYDVLSGSNAYSALAHCYGDLSIFGCYAGIVRGDFEDVINIRSFPVGSYLMAQNDRDNVDTLHWSISMTAREIVQQFGIENVSDRVKSDYESNRMSARHKVQAALEPRLDHDPMKAAVATNMPIAAYYWEASRKDKLLHIGGLDFDVILAPRWDTVIGDPWPSTSPGRDALGDIKQLQAQQRDKDTAIQMTYKPPLMGPAAGAGFNYHPGAYNAVTMGSMEKGGPVPVFNVRPDVSHLLQNVQETQRRVDEAFYADLFRMTSEYGLQGAKDVTAFAIAEMKEEKLIVLGPVLESLDRGLLSPLIKATFHYAQKARILPPPPDEIDGAAVQVEFTSILAQAQRAIGVAAIERTIGFVGTVASFDPSAIDNVDADALVHEFASQVGFPATGLRSKEAVEATRAARDQAQQQQQMLAAAPQMAQAANLISEASERGNAALMNEGIL